MGESKVDRPVVVPGAGRESVDVRVLRAVLDLPHQIADRLDGEHQVTPVEIRRHGVTETPAPVEEVVNDVELADPLLHGGQVRRRDRIPVRPALQMEVGPDLDPVDQRRPIVAMSGNVGQRRGRDSDADHGGDDHPDASRSSPGRLCGAKVPDQGQPPRARPLSTGSSSPTSACPTVRLMSSRVCYPTRDIHHRLSLTIRHDSHPG